MPRARPRRARTNVGISTDDARRDRESANIQITNRKWQNTRSRDGASATRERTHAHRTVLFRLVRRRTLDQAHGSRSAPTRVHGRSEIAVRHATQCAECRHATHAWVSRHVDVHTRDTTRVPNGLGAQARRKKPRGAVSARTMRLTSAQAQALARRCLIPMGRETWPRAVRRCPAARSNWSGSARALGYRGSGRAASCSRRGCCSRTRSCRATAAA